MSGRVYKQVSSVLCYNWSGVPTDVRALGCHAVQQVTWRTDPGTPYSRPLDLTHGLSYTIHSLPQGVWLIHDQERLKDETLAHLWLAVVLVSVLSTYDLTVDI